MIQFRSRKPPVDREKLYGEFASDMIQGTEYFARTVDCAAYVHITGCFPTHLRSKRSTILRQICESHPRPTSVDGRDGCVKLKEDAIRDMKIERHPMVKAAREKVEQRFKIQRSLGQNSRLGHSKIYMFQYDPQTKMQVNPITLALSGAVKSSWD